MNLVEKREGVQLSFQLSSSCRQNSGGLGPWAGR